MLYFHVHHFLAFPDFVDLRRYHHLVHDDELQIQLKWSMIDDGTSHDFGAYQVFHEGVLDF